MTKDDIIRMAREAGLIDPMVFYAGYERFANLVAAAERDACVKVCDDLIGTRAMAVHCADAIRARTTP